MPSAAINTFSASAVVPPGLVTLTRNCEAGSLDCFRSSPLPATLKTYNAPVSNDAAAIEFKQSIARTEPLRTGSYSKTLTFTLSTTQP